MESVDLQTTEISFPGENECFEGGLYGIVPPWVSLFSQAPPPSPEEFPSLNLATIAYPLPVARGDLAILA